MASPTISPISSPTTLYASPSLPPRGGGSHGCSLTCIRSQQAFDFAEEPSETGRSFDSLVDDLREAAVVRADAAALVMGAGAHGMAATGPARSTLRSPQPSSSRLPSPSMPPSAPGVAAWNVRWVERGGGGLPAGLRRLAVELVRGRSGRSLRPGRH